jgi:hypothetical protein
MKSAFDPVDFFCFIVLSFVVFNFNLWGGYTMMETEKVNDIKPAPDSFIWRRCTLYR